MGFKSQASWLAAIGLALTYPSLQVLQTPFNIFSYKVGQVTCKCSPGEACWPSKSDWDDFNKTIDGRLVATVPLASVCHDDQFKAYSESTCARLQSVWHFPEVHFEDSSSLMAPYFANQSCEPFYPRDSQCVIGSLVQYSVNVSEIVHIQRSLLFAQKKNIRFVIRNTGHDYYGKSNGAGGLAIWTHHIKQMQMVDWESTEYSGKAIKMGAGVQSHELWTYMKDYGYVTPGGHCPTVGIAGGYTQGGGHGPLASQYGLGADNVLEWEVIDSTGKLLKANQHQNQDLYWALSGGGGGTYGVAWSLTSKAYKDQATSAGNLTFTSTGVSDNTFWEGVNTFVSNLPQMTDAGIACVWFVMGNIFAMTPMIGPNVEEAQMKQTLQPTLDKLKKLGITYQSSVIEYPDFLSSYDAMTPPSNTSFLQIGGRLITRSLIQDNISGLGKVLRNITEAGFPISGVTVNVGRQPSFPNNSVNPLWRETVFSFVTGSVWDDSDWNKNIKNQHAITDTVMPQIEKLTPGGAAYLNEADPFTPNWQEVMYGDNYDKLKSIKAKYDPSSFFHANKAVGSDEWHEDSNGKLCRIKD